MFLQLLRNAGHIFTDAAFEQSTKTGGLGGVLFNGKADLCSWFGIEVSHSTSLILGARLKESLISELELLASIVAMQLWGRDSNENLHVCYGDNDSVRFSLIRASGSGDVACALLAKYLEWEAENNVMTWFARVPTEANIADFPSRFQKLEILSDDLSCNDNAASLLTSMLDGLSDGKPHDKRG